MDYFVLMSQQKLNVSFGYNNQIVLVHGVYDNEQTVKDVCDEKNGKLDFDAFISATELRYQLLKGLQEIDYTYHDTLYDVDMIVMMNGKEFESLTDVETEKQAILANEWLNEKIYSHRIWERKYFYVPRDINQFYDKIVNNEFPVPDEYGF